MKAGHGGKTKNREINSRKTAEPGRPYCKNC
jgi:hypothetical protein